MRHLAPDEIDQLLDAHFAGEIGKDVEATLETFTDDVEHDVAGAPVVGHGKLEAASFYHDLFSQLTILRIDKQRRLYGAGFAVDDSVATCTADHNPFGFEGRGRVFSFRLLHVFEFADGRIARENAWIDMGAVARQLA